MLVIDQPYLEEKEGKTKLISDIDVDGVIKQIYFEVENEYAKYLCYERGDAFLIGLLNWAMRHGHDIKSVAPITEELLYNINKFLIPSLTKYDKALTPIKIVADMESEPIKNAGGVGTGISCGIDSLYAIHNNYKSEYKGMSLTHLCINSVGSFHNGYKEYGVDKARNEIYERAQRLADEIGLPLIKSMSNIKEEFEIYFEHGHTYYSMFAVYCMQKLWKIYYYGSSGRDFSAFSLKDNSKNSTALYELLSLPCFSTHNLHLYSDGGAVTRMDKTLAIADDKLTQKYLHVCCTKGENCNVCLKCRRTLLTLDLLGKLENFKDVFDIEYYKNHKKEYLLWLYESYLTGDKMYDDLYEQYKKQLRPAVIQHYMHKVFSIRKTENKTVIKFLALKLSIKNKNY